MRHAKRSEWLKRRTFAATAIAVAFFGQLYTPLALADHDEVPHMGGFFSGQIVTQDGDDFPIIIADGSGPRYPEFPNSGETGISIQIPSQTVSGNFEGQTFSFTPGGKLSLSATDGDVSIVSQSKLTLSSNVPVSANATYYPFVSANIDEIYVFDSLEIYPEDTSHYGKPAQFDLVFELSGDLSASVGTGTTTEVMAQARYFFLGSDSNGAINTRRSNGSTTNHNTGDFDLANPITITIPNYQATLGPADPEQSPPIFSFEFQVETSVYIGGPAGSSVTSTATVELKNLRIQNVRTLNEQTPLPLETLKSISASGHDWIGNGEPDLPEAGDEFSWDNAGSGSFALADNWVDTETALNASSPPSAGDTARFGNNSAYTVDVGSATIAKLVVGDSLGSSPEVTFTNADLNIDSLSTDPPAALVESASLILDGGSVNSNFVTIGRVASSRLSLTDGASWNNAGRFELDNFGLLQISSGSQLSSAETHLANTASSLETALVALAGENSHWQPGNLSIGYQGGADVIVSNNAKVTAGTISLGTQPNSAGALSFDTASTLSAQSTIIGDQGEGTVTANGEETDLEFGDLHIGKTAAGTLEMSGGATALAQSLKVGGALGEVVLSGVSEDQVPTTLEIAASTNTVIGSTTTLAMDPIEGYVAQVDVLEGAFFNVGSGLQVGGDSSGSVIIDGWDSDTQDRSTLSVTGNLAIGSLDKGELSVRNGGFVEADTLSLDLLSEFRSTATISGVSDGLASKLVVEGKVSLHGSELAITEGAEAELGRVVIGGFLAIDPIPDPEEELPTLRVSGYDPTTGTAASAQLEQLTVGNYDSNLPDSYGPGELIVEGGADVSVAHDIRFGFFSSGYGIVDGFSTGDSARSSSLTTSETLIVGFTAPGESVLEIQNGANVSSKDASLDLFNETESTVSLDGFGNGSNAIWYVERNFSIGANGRLSLSATGSVTIGDPRVLSGKVTIGTGGTLSGTGVIETSSNPEVQGGVSNFAGTVRPGQSPGTLTIMGDYEQGPEGTLVMEVAGPDPSDQDRLVVDGDVTLSGTVQIVFTHSAPTLGNTIPLVEVGGDYTEENLKMEIQGLEAGFLSRSEIVDGKLTLIAESDGVLIPLQEPPPVEPLKFSSDGALKWSIETSQKTEYILETSLDLVDWQELDRRFGTGASHTFLQDPIDETARFYRLTTISY